VNQVNFDVKELIQSEKITWITENTYNGYTRIAGKTTLVQVTREPNSFASTLDQIKYQSNYGPEVPSWKAVSFGESGKEVDPIKGKPKHAEVAIIYKLPDMVLQYYTIENKFPENIYFFYASCPLSFMCYKTCNYDELDVGCR